MIKNKLSIKNVCLFALLILAALYLFFGSDVVYADSPDNVEGTPYDNNDQEEGYAISGGAKYNYRVVHNLLDSSKDYIYITSVEYGSSVEDTFTVPNSVKHGAGSEALPVTGIADKVFKNNIYVTDVYVGPNMKSYGNQCFYGCTKLKTIPMTPDLESIGQECFYGCEGLRSVGISASVTSIGAGAFANCPNVPSIEVAYGNNRYYTEDGILYSSDKQILVACPAGYAKNGVLVNSFTVPDTVKTIWPQAFEGCSFLETVFMKEPLTTIGDKAFYNCSRLSNVTIPPTVTLIGEDVFRGCPSYLLLTVEKSGVGVAEDYAKAHGLGVTVYCTVRFYDGNVLKKTQVVKKGESATPPSVGSGADEIPERIGYKLAWSREFTNVQDNIDVYADWKQQYKITFEEVTGDIANRRTTVDYAYYGESVRLPAWEKKGYILSVTPEDQKAIDFVTKDMTIYVSWVISLTGWEIEEELPSLNDTLNQDKISYQIISYTGADNRVAIIGCTKNTAKYINIPNEITYRGAVFKVTFIRPRAFQNMKNLKRVTFGNNVKTIGIRAFEGCTKLDTIVINSTQLGTVGYRSFKNINSKAKVNVPNSLIKKYKRKLIDAGLPAKAVVY